MSEITDLLSLAWNQGLIRPMTNGLVLLYLILFNNFGLSVLVFTVFVRVLTLPLTVRQTRATRAISQLQPKLKELQKKHAKDRQKLSQETFRLYRENGINPLGCLGPLVIQMPIWIALYWSLIKALPANPESIVSLSGVLYTWFNQAHAAVPLDSSFLWLDLAHPDPFPILPILVGASMWGQQKMMTPLSADPRQRQTNQMMLWMMPLMFMFFTFQFPSGLALYWVASNIVGMAIQYKIAGWGGLNFNRKEKTDPTTEIVNSDTKELEDEGDDGSVRKDDRGSHRNRTHGARRRPRRGRGRGNSPR
ncbi:MAG: membrane protein insertase YidC [SAR202 cluster bacterium]|nr:membrane protein insertase YidC [SAR202 cluster bacterium]